MPTIRPSHLIHSMLNSDILVRLILCHSTLVSRSIVKSSQVAKFQTAGPLLSARIMLAQSSSVRVHGYHFSYGAPVIQPGFQNYACAFSARIIIVKVHTVTTFPTEEPLLSAYVPELSCTLPIGELADTS